MQAVRSLRSPDRPDGRPLLQALGDLVVQLIFRLTIVVSVFLYAALAVLPFFDDQLLTYLEQGARELAGANSRIPYDAWQFWVYFVAFLIASIGLYFFMPWSRVVFIFLLAASIPINLFGGVQVLTSYEIVIGSLLGICDGAIIAMMYLTSVGESFDSSVT